MKVNMLRCTILAINAIVVLFIGGQAMAGQYAGDVKPAEAWQALQSNSAAALVDVRTQPEWVFVGGPELSGIKKSVAQVSWQVYPTMTRNPNFLAEIQAKGITPDKPVYLLCRTGARSKSAAEFLTEYGYTAYNVAEGFEGQIDGQGHRGAGGWKTAGLPWKQN